MVIWRNRWGQCPCISQFLDPLPLTPQERWAPCSRQSKARLEQVSPRLPKILQAFSCDGIPSWVKKENSAYPTWLFPSRELNGCHKKEISPRERAIIALSDANMQDKILLKPWAFLLKLFCVRWCVRLPVLLRNTAPPRKGALSSNSSRISEVHAKRPTLGWKLPIPDFSGTCLTQKVPWKKKR